MVGGGGEEGDSCCGRWAVVVCQRNKSEEDPRVVRGLGEDVALGGWGLDCQGLQSSREGLGLGWHRMGRDEEYVLKRRWPV